MNRAQRKERDMSVLEALKYAERQNDVAKAFGLSASQVTVIKKRYASVDTPKVKITKSRYVKVEEPVLSDEVLPVLELVSVKKIALPIATELRVDDMYTASCMVNMGHTVKSI